MRVFILIFFMWFPILSHADAESAIFAGIKWGSSPRMVVDKLKELGFTVPNTKDATGSPAIHLDDGVLFAREGRLNMEKAQVAAIFKDNKLLKVRVVLLTDDNDAIPKYVDMRKFFTEKHGVPETDVFQFTSPYYAGDGYEQQAIKLEKAKIYAVWGTYLSLEITKALTIGISYESPEWKAESDRRKEKATSVF